MARTTHGKDHGILAGAVVAAAVLAFLPVRWGGWISDVGGVALSLLAPISHPIAAFSAWAAPGPTPYADDERLATIQRERDRFEALFRQQQLENEKLQTLVGELQRGVSVDPDLPLRLIPAPVIGASTDPLTPLLNVRAGRGKGVSPNAVAAVEGVHIVGRVVRTAPATSWVQLITDRSSGRVEGRVIIDESRTVRCSLTPLGNKRLQGTIAPGEANASLIQVGQRVILSDATWPAAAQALVIGRITEMPPPSERPQIPVVTVEPEFDLARISRVTLRVESEGAPK